MMWLAFISCVTPLTSAWRAAAASTAASEYSAQRPTMMAASTCCNRLLHILHDCRAVLAQLRIDI